MVIGQGLSASGSPFLPGFQDHHLARFTLHLAFAVMLEHTLLQNVRHGLDVLATLVLDYPERAEPDLGINPYEIGQLFLVVRLGHSPFDF